MTLGVLRSVLGGLIAVNPDRVAALIANRPTKDHLAVTYVDFGGGEDCGIQVVGTVADVAAVLGVRIAL